jgi:hypothetical protein
MPDNNPQKAIDLTSFSVDIIGNKKNLLVPNKP